MGKQTMSSACVEKQTKVHGADFRSMARQRRLVCVAVLVALLPFVITCSYVVFYPGTTSNVPPGGFFRAPGQPALAAEKDVLTSLPNDADSSSNGDSALPSPNGDFELPSSNGDSELQSPTDDEVEQKPTDDEVEQKPTDDEVEQKPSSIETEESPIPGSSANGSLPIIQQNVSEATPTRAEESIVMEASLPQASEGECKLEEGKWVPDSRPPLYNSSSCKFIQGHQNCHKNGRPDDGYLFWKWKPDQCDEVPRIDAPGFLRAMRHRSVVFAGDSIARNQFQSLLCILSQAEVPRHTFWTEDGRHNTYHFESSNFTLIIRWSPYLVRAEEKLITWPDNTTETVTHIYVDELDDNWVTSAAGAAILHISTGQWWYKRAVYLEDNKVWGCHACPSCDKQTGFHPPYTKAIGNVLRGSLKIPGFSGTTVYRSFSPEHFENGAWDTGGACVRTTPGGVPMSYDTTTLYEIQKTQFKNITDELGKDRLKLLGITELAQSRADGHPNKYRSEDQKISDKLANGVPNDCLHWCLPGPIDTWNDLLVHSLHDVIFKYTKTQHIIKKSTNNLGKREVKDRAEGPIQV